MNTIKQQSETSECDVVIERFDDYLGDTLAPSLQQTTGDHIDCCPKCSKLFAEHESYLQVMLNYNAPEPRPGQLAHLLRQARHDSKLIEQMPARTHSQSSAASFYKGFAAASVMLLTLFGVTQLNEPSLPDRSVVATVVDSVGEKEVEPMARIQDVTIVINVPHDMQAANLALDFPDALRLEGLEDLQRVAWAVDLTQGANVLTLPLSIVSERNLNGSLVIAASVEYHNNIRDFQLAVELSPSQKPRQGALLANEPAENYI